MKQHKLVTNVLIIVCNWSYVVKVPLDVYGIPTKLSVNEYDPITSISNTGLRVLSFNSKSYKSTKISRYCFAAAE